VDLENWVMLGEPPTKVDAHRALVVDNKILDIYPRTGALAPGQRSMLTLSYLHDFQGEHTMPIIISVDKGKKLHLVLTGKTLDLGVPVLEYLSTEYFFQPVALGETLPPVQLYELRNIGTAPVSYIMDATPLEHLKNAAYGFQVLECLNPQGTVPVGGSTFVKFRFQPIEAKTYQVDIPVTIVGQDATTVRFYGRGYHPKEECTFKKLPEEENILCTHWPRYSVTPSEELEALTCAQFSLTYSALDLGPMLALSVSRRVMTLVSHSPKPFTFDWDLKVTEALEGRLVVEPSAGRLEPFDHLMFKLTYTAGGWPEKFDVEIRCLLSPVPELHEPEPETSDECQFEVHGRHFVQEAVRQSKLRESVAHSHTQASMGKFPNTSMHPKPPTGFPTDFNMAATMTMTAQQPARSGGAAPSVLTLAVLGGVHTQPQYLHLQGDERRIQQYVPLNTHLPKRETLPPQLPPSDVKKILEDLLLEVMEHPEVTSMFSPKHIADDLPITFDQLHSDYTPVPRFLVNKYSLIEPTWKELLLTYREPSCLRFLSSFQPPPASPPPLILEEESVGLLKLVPPMDDKKKDKRSAAEIEAEELAKQEAAEAALQRKEEEAIREAEEEAEVLRLQELAKAEKVRLEKQRIVGIQEACIVAAEARKEKLKIQMEASALELKRKKFLQSPECMQLAEIILEGTLFNLLKENHKTHVLMN